jgi:hypothetical protein
MIKTGVRLAKYAAASVVVSAAATKAVLVARPDVERRFETWLFATDLRAYTEAVSSLKRRHFSNLPTIIPRSTVSSPRDLASRDGDNVLKITELGSGPGVNLQFYPKNSVVAVVDPCAEFSSYVEEEAEKSGIKLQKYIVGEL